ncbi:hypothetical protein BC830DRAFT_305150 [Chytriomyces sp. MP71]|nr:hypothetical protein BC830DRAFT_305150 [Chytriomyces sp. MP71]
MTRMQEIRRTSSDIPAIGLGWARHRPIWGTFMSFQDPSATFANIISCVLPSGTNAIVFSSPSCNIKPCRIDRQTGATSCDDPNESCMCAAIPFPSDDINAFCEYQVLKYAAFNCPDPSQAAGVISHLNTGLTVPDISITFPARITSTSLPSPSPPTTFTPPPFGCGPPPLFNGSFPPFPPPPFNGSFPPPPCGPPPTATSNTGDSSRQSSDAVNVTLIAIVVFGSIATMALFIIAFLVFRHLKKTHSNSSSDSELQQLSKSMNISQEDSTNTAPKQETVYASYAADPMLQIPPVNGFANRDDFFDDQSMFSGESSHFSLNTAEYHAALVAPKHFGNIDIRYIQQQQLERHQRMSGDALRPSTEVPAIRIESPHPL